MDWSNLFWWILIWVVSAIPLNLAVKMMCGRSSIVKVMLVNVIVAVLAVLIDSWMGNHTFIASVLGFIALLFVYKVMFRMGWIRSFLAWVLQFVIMAIIIVVLVLLGVGLVLL